MTPHDLIQHLNSYIRQPQMYRPPRDFAMQMQRHGWKPWQYVAWDEETETFQFFDSYDSYERYLRIDAQKLVDNFMPSYLTWEHLWDFVYETEMIDDEK